jgi:HKD family nuclease
MKLYTNSNSKLDFIGKRLERICINTNLHISVAFFSHSEFILNAIKNGCSKINLLIRLDTGTDPNELKRIHNNPNVNIRYYSSRRFHPKLYIVDGVCAIIGSSNLTKSGLGQNLELNVEIENDDPLYDDIKFEFSNEWEHAAVLTDEILSEFKRICDEHSSRMPDISRIISSKFGEIAPDNITTYNKKETSQVFIENFRKEYQQYISAFQRLKTIYNAISPERKYNSDFPLRIEVDGFLSWLWDFQCDHSNYSNPILSDEKIQLIVASLKKEFLDFTGNNYYDNLQNIRSILEFSTIEKIQKLTIDSICNILERVWAFHDRLRFYTGGLPAMQEEFKRKNGEKIKETIMYILYGNGDYVVRIYDALFSEKYKLSLFGESCVKELFGLVNKNDIPICNERTKKVMQWLGFGHL